MERGIRSDQKIRFSEEDSGCRITCEGLKVEEADRELQNKKMMDR